jgi:hypothetical protein
MVYQFSNSFLCRDLLGFFYNSEETADPVLLAILCELIVSLHFQVL